MISIARTLGAVMPLFCVGREYGGAPTLQGSYRSKRTLAERDDPPGAVPAREHHQLDVVQTELEVPATARKLARHAELLAGQAFGQEGYFSLKPETRCF